MRYLVSICYDGSKFYGFQRLHNHYTVQEEVEKALTILNKKEVRIKGAGRTDRGVHALDQKVSFDLDVDIPPERLKNALNSILRPNISANEVEIVEKDFHARFKVLKKTYTYVVNLGEFDTIKDSYLYNYNRSLDIQSMKKAIKYLKGIHNFKAFTSGTRDNYESIIYETKIKKKRNLLYFTFTGKSFYRYMVRNMVGSLIAVGEGKLKPSDIEQYLIGKNVHIHYVTAPPNGLYLTKIVY